eukprot:98743-Prymnesium_polylepis.1
MAPRTRLCTAHRLPACHTASCRGPSVGRWDSALAIPPTCLTQWGGGRRVAERVAARGLEMCHDVGALAAFELGRLALAGHTSKLVPRRSTSRGSDCRLLVSLSRLHT